MRKNRKLWLALSALTAAAPTAATAATDTATEQEQAGVAGMVNPDVKGELTGEESRVLFVGSDVFRNETIRTDAAGITHLLFLDRSSLTIGPNSEVVIDRFVYDPGTGNGELSLSATTGILRFVGGALSKTDDVTIRTPVGTLGIRGGVTLIESNGSDGDTIAWFIYGDELNGASLVSGDSRKVVEHEYGLRITPDGKIKIIGPIEPTQMEPLLADLRGSPDSIANKQEVELPIIKRRWLEELVGQNIRDQVRQDEKTSIDFGNRDIDNLAS